MRVENGKLAGSIVHAYHRDANTTKPDALLQLNPPFAVRLAPNTGPAPVCPNDLHTGEDNPRKGLDDLLALEGRAEQDARVRISGQYQRCVGDCDPVSNPHAMDIAIKVWNCGTRNSTGQICNLHISEPSDSDYA